MKLEKCIAQLQDLRQDRESFLDGKYNPVLDKGRPEFADNPFVADIEAIDTALAAIEELQKAKSLIKTVYDDIKRYADGMCRVCSNNDGWKCNCEDFCATNGRKKWEYIHKAEIIKLIGDDENEGS